MGVHREGSPRPRVPTVTDLGCRKPIMECSVEHSSDVCPTHPNVIDQHTTYAVIIYGSCPSPGSNVERGVDTAVDAGTCQPLPTIDFQINGGGGSSSTRTSQIHEDRPTSSTTPHDSVRPYVAIQILDVDSTGDRTTTWEYIQHSAIGVGYAVGDRHTIARAT